MEAFAPSPRVSSIIDNWNPYYIERVRAVIEGTWESEDTWHGIDEGMTGIGAFTDAIPADVQASAQAIVDALSAGEMHSFTGPINKQDGSPWLAEGETADDGTLLGMNFYVEGIDDSLPQ